MRTAKETVRQVSVKLLKPNPWDTEVGPPLSVEDYETLRISIRRNGIQVPLIAWKRGKQLVLLSGSNRLKVAKELGLKNIPVLIRQFEDENAAKTFALSDNLARRQLSVGQRAYLAYQYQQMLSVGKGRRTDLQPSSNLRKVDAWKEAAQKAGISEGSLAAIKAVIDSGDEGLLKSVLCGEKTLHTAVRAVKSVARAASLFSRVDRQERIDSTVLIHGDCRKKLGTIESGSVDVVITDPPYPCIDRAYGRMTEAKWQDMMQDVVQECRRVLKPTGSAVFILQPNFEKVGRMRLWAWRFALWAAEEWNLVQDAYWWCVNTPPTHSASRKVGLMRQAVKWCLWLGSPNCVRNQDAVLWTASESTAALKWEDRCLQYKPNGQTIRSGRIAEISVERNGSTPFNLLPIAAAHPTEHRGHPASTPRALADWWCRYILPPGGVLLDPFCGSGTMLAAGLDNGASKVIGIDKEKKYLTMSMSRIKKGWR